MKSITPHLAALALSLFCSAPHAVAQTEKQSDAKPVKVVMETSKGAIELELDSAKAPITVANFVKYVKKGHYDGLIFHRVIPTFMIQGGGYTPELEQRPVDAPIQIESKNGLKNKRGTIAMARTGDPNSATSQFFINVTDNDNLDYPSFDGFGYTVFGKVTKGIEVVDAIKDVETIQKMGREKAFPVEPIIIKSAKIAE
ncbi:MAG: peptidylprolyl isomerase [Verrucomicrobiaceae bacterium]